MLRAFQPLSVSLFSSVTLQRSSFKPALSAIALLVSGALHAEEQTLTVRDVERIEVRGDFRGLAVNKIPGSLTVVDSNEISRQSAQVLEDLLQGMANVNYASGASRGRFLQVRGIGERSEFVDTINPSVGVLVDGIDYSALGLGSLIDIGQLEVFRGPESTRFGAAAMAGMLNYQSKDPGSTAETSLSATLANYDSYQTEIAHNAVFSDVLSARFAAQLQQSDGFIENTHLKRDDTNNIDEQHFHSKWRYQPSAQLKLDAVLNYHLLDNGYDAFSLNRDRTTLSDQPGQDVQEIWAGSLSADYLVTPALRSVTVMTAATADTDYGYDEDWSFIGIHPWEYSTADQYLRDRKQWSFDQRLQSAQGQHWVAGLFAAQQDVDLERRYTDNFESSTSVFDSEYQRDQLALYGEATFELSARTALTAGARAEHVKIGYDDSAKTSQSPSDWMWGGKLALEHQLSDQLTAYALMSRGYKAGGVNGEALTQIGNPRFSQYWEFLRQQAVFAPESLTNREVGLKGSLLQQSLVTRLAWFDMLRQDMQVNSWINQGTRFAGYISNASAGRTRGIELESSYQASERARLFVSVGLLDSQIEGYTAAVDVDGKRQFVDLTGRDQAHAPRRQTQLGLELALLDQLMLDFNYQYKGAFFYSDSHFFKAKAVELVNLRLSWQQDALKLALWTRNLLNKDYGVRGFYFPNDPRDEYSTQEWQQLGEPRRIGLTATYQF
jgi:iron complex outermembrane receptor protein